MTSGISAMLHTAASDGGCGVGVARPEVGGGIMSTYSILERRAVGSIDTCGITS